MFDTLKRYKTTLIILIILVGLFFVYQQFFVGVELPVLSRSGASDNAIAAGAEIVKILAELKALEINTAFFDDETYRSLVDLTQTITPEPVGRQNPFEFIGNGVDIQGVTAYPIDPFAEVIDPLSDTADTNSENNFESEMVGETMTE